MRYRLCLFVLLCCLGVPVQAQVSGLSYTFAPVGSRINFDVNAGISNAYTYGGAIGLGFGEYLELSAEYSTSDGAKVNFSRYGVSDSIRTILAVRDGVPVQIDRMGLSMRLNLGRGTLLPFVQAGTGIQTLKPEGMAKNEQIYTALGGGVQVTWAERYTASVGVQRMFYRYNPYATFNLGEAALGLDEALFPVRTTYNTTLNAALRVYLGGRSPGQLTEVDRAIMEELSRPRIFVNPFYGSIEFNKELSGFPKRQPMAGVMAGVDLGPFVGIRAVYAQATDEDEVFAKGPFSFRGMQQIGGEMALRLGNDVGGGVTPYVALGGGYLHFRSSYVAPNVGRVPDSRYYASAGGGVYLTMTPNVRLTAGVRSMFMANQDLQDVASPSSVFSSLAYTGGIEFSLGGGDARGALVRQRARLAQEQRVAELELDRLRQEREAQVAELRAEMEGTRPALSSATAEAERLRAEIAALRAERELARQARERGETPASAAEVERRVAEQVATTVPTVAAPAEAIAAPRVQAPRASSSNLSGQVVTLPVPEVGEIYVRFGPLEGEPAPATASPMVISTSGAGTVQSATPAAGLTAEQIQALVRETIQQEWARLRAELPAPAPVQPGVSEAQVRSAIQEALQAQVNQLSQLTNADAAAAAAALQRLENRLAQVESRPPVQIQAPAAPQQAPVTVVTPRPESRDTQAVAERRTSSSRGGGFLGREFVTVYPLIGYRLGQNKRQFLVGGRMDYRGSGGSAPYIQPELFVGLGDGTSIQSTVLAVFPILVPIEERNYGVHAGFGGGFATRAGLRGFTLATNTMVGMNIPTGPGSVMVELSALNFFRYTRFMVGYRLGF